MKNNEEPSVWNHVLVHNVQAELESKNGKKHLEPITAGTAKTAHFTSLQARSVVTGLRQRGRDKR